MAEIIKYNDQILFLLLAVPFITSILCFLVSFLGKGKQKLAYLINFIGLLGLFLVSGAILFELHEKESLFGAENWLHLDSLSGVFLFVLVLISFATGIYSHGYTKEEVKHNKINERTLCHYFGFFHLFIFTMLITITTNNIILMWAGIEATTLSSAFLVGIYGKKSSLEAAWKYIIICTVGVAFGLYGTILVYSNASSAMLAAGGNISDAIFWTEAVKYAGAFDQTLMSLAFVFIVIGFGTKAGLFPMHAWLPDAHSEAPSPTSALLSAVLLKCAFFVILRYYIIVNRVIDSNMPQKLLLTFGVLSIFVSAFFFFRQTDIKRKLAYSSVENMGIIAVSMGFGGALGIFAALLHIVNHSIVKTLLFCTSGNVLLKYGSRDTSVVRGMLKVMPLSAILLAGGSLALGGLPPFNIFFSEFFVVVAGIKSGNTLLTLFVLLLLMVVLAGLVRLIAQCIFGEAPQNMQKGELGVMTLLPTYGLLILIIVMGVSIPKPVTKMLMSATTIVLDGRDGVSSIKNNLTLPFHLSTPTKDTVQEGQSTSGEENK